MKLPESFHEEIGRRVQLGAKRKGWSVYRLAEFAGVSRGLMFYIVNAERSASVGTLKKIADALGVDVRDLLPPAK
jgi:transcriptional regulator with XRE-family HTH domain